MFCSRHPSESPIYFVSVSASGSTTLSFLPKGIRKIERFSVFFNEATADNQNTWELGDVFEVFVRRADRDAYTEVHVTPNGTRLHLKFPDRGTIALARGGQLDGDTLKHDTAEIVAHAWRTGEGWIGLLGVPVDALPGETVCVSVCRYDAHTDRTLEPDVSSTSSHAECDFHRPDDWPAYTVPAG